MSDLKLESLRIQNFRTFKDLKIDRLGRVNLIVGKNNVGKTSLLESLWVWARRGRFSVLWTLLEEHDEARHAQGTNSTLNRPHSRELVETLVRLFHGRHFDFPERSSIGPVDEGWGTLDIQLSLEKDHPESDMQKEVGGLGKGGPLLLLMKDSDIIGQYPLTEGRDKLENIWLAEEAEEEEGIYLRSNGLDRDARMAFWDDIIRGIGEERIYEALRIVEERLQDVRFVGTDESGERVPIARTTDFSERVPLRSLGEGVRRAFDVALGLERSRNGVLLLDEIENGLHYSVQPDLWRMIFETARELNVQVFATTHSHDCVQAFQEVASGRDEEGMLISLRRRRDDPEDIVAVPIEEDELEYAVRSHTDVR